MKNKTLRVFKSIVFIGLYFASNIICGQDFKQSIDRVYNFNPANLSDEERITKSSQLDSIWTLVKSDTTKYLGELRQELKDTSHHSFFYFDGSSLLMTLSQSKPDLTIVSKALLKCELDGVAHFDYFRMGLMLSYYKINTLEIAKKILKMEEFKPYIMQHAMYWGKDMCLVWLLHQLDDKMFVNDIIPMFNSVNNDSKMAIISYLYYSCTCEGDTFIKECSENKNLDKEIKEHATVLTKMMDKKRSDNPEKYKELITERKKLLMGIGDEVLMRFVDQTKEIKKEYTCR